MVMKTKVFMLILIFLGMVSCKSQESKSGKMDENINKPHENFYVTKKYDEYGNLIEFDSTYTSYYGNQYGDTLLTDSIMRNFNMYFDQHFAGMNPEDFMSSDSIMHQDFFSDDFFEKQFYQQNELMLKMMREMDSVKNEYFRMHPHNFHGMKM